MEEGERRRVGEMKGQGSGGGREEEGGGRGMDGWTGV